MAHAFLLSSYLALIPPPPQKHLNLPTTRITTIVVFFLRAGGKGLHTNVSLRKGGGG